MIRAVSPIGGHGDIRICPAFFRYDIGTAPRARGHEADQGENGFRDQTVGNNRLAYAAAAAQQLATSDPAEAMISPDNQTNIILEILVP